VRLHLWRRVCGRCCAIALTAAQPRSTLHGHARCSAISHVVQWRLLLHERACCATVHTAPCLRIAARVCSPTSECAHWTRVCVTVQLGVCPLDCARSLVLNPVGNGRNSLQQLFHDAHRTPGDPERKREGGKTRSGGIEFSTGLHEPGKGLFGCECSCLHSVGGRGYYNVP
jgi:hypothetical protein